jgi:hypothetical protein
MKEIYDFVEMEKIQSFHSVAYGFLPHITLDQLRTEKIDPVLHILLNTAKKSYLLDKNKLSQRFKDIPIVFEHYDPSLWVDL